MFIRIVQIENRASSTCQANINTGFRLSIVNLPTRQMTVIMVLVNNVNISTTVNHSPFFTTTFVNHPIIPTCTANNEIGDVLIAGFWEKEKIASSGTVKLTLTIDHLPHTAAPVS